MTRHSHPFLCGNMISRRQLLIGAAAGGAALALGPAKAADSSLNGTWRAARAFETALMESVFSGHIVGATAVVAQAGQVVFQKAFGFADREAGQAMRVDSLYRLASMTKPIVCVTALALAERELLQLDAPITRWLPDFQPRLADGSTPTITLRHLLTHTSGLGYGFLEEPDGPYHRLGVSDGMDGSGLTLAENVRRIAQAPLLFAPGTAWHYSVAIDVLGAVIEQATGRPLADAVREVVTAPLGMDSVRFVAPEGASLVTAYGDATPEPVKMSDPFALKFGKSAIAYSPGRAFDPNAFPSGGTGMVGTALDYLRFAEAMRTGGGGVIKPETVAAMTRNAVGDFAIDAAGPGYGWGLGVAILKNPKAAKLPLSAGSWNWSGVYGTHFWVDPASQLSVVVLTNTAVAGMTGAFALATRNAAYAA
ncbi:serine hydrolase domain-containing protein [Sodalis ligni]|uniref:CubicO group peptidase (Beta-lactamase class C family) n=1 Tax=Sodalis ligni TaxID=2697027 RepID=A0A4R1NB29_9GAMM|nr:serine hydrolase domain-containing protein [Sodalis ligni]TCL04634.1 CubicO group peptidase (beta-lactamase class C family) [Sodalis ligni]